MHIDMRKQMRRLAGVAVAGAVLGLAFPAGAALAINTVPCTDPNFVNISFENIGNGSVCYANGGDVAVNIHNVVKVTPGNNTVIVNFQNGTQYYSDTIPKYSPGISFPDVWIYELRIL